MWPVFNEKLWDLQRKQAWDHIQEKKKNNSHLGSKLELPEKDFKLTVINIFKEQKETMSEI